MSENNESLEWAWGHHGTTPVEKLVLLDLAANAKLTEGGEWECMRSYTEIAERAWMNKVTAINNCKSLIDKEIITLMRRGNGHGMKNIYKLNL